MIYFRKGGTALTRFAQLFQLSQESTFLHHYNAETGDQYHLLD